jgi:hypothetical protein
MAGDANVDDSPQQTTASVSRRSGLRLGEDMVNPPFYV